jgi:hypothetical protein
MESRMDAMRQNLSVFGGVLKIPWAGSYRYYECYAIGLDRMFQERDHFHMTMCPFEVELVALQPFGRDQIRTSTDGRIYPMTTVADLLIAGNVLLLKGLPARGPHPASVAYVATSHYTNLGHDEQHEAVIAALAGVERICATGKIRSTHGTVARDGDVLVRDAKFPGYQIVFYNVEGVAFSVQLFGNDSISRMEIIS